MQNRGGLDIPVDVTQGLSQAGGTVTGLHISPDFKISGGQIAGHSSLAFTFFNVSVSVVNLAFTSAAISAERVSVTMPEALGGSGPWTLDNFVLHGDSSVDGAITTPVFGFKLADFEVNAPRGATFSRAGLTAPRVELTLPIFQGGFALDNLVYDGHGIRAGGGGSFAHMGLPAIDVGGFSIVGAEADMSIDVNATTGHIEYESTGRGQFDIPGASPGRGNQAYHVAGAHALMPGYVAVDALYVPRPRLGIWHVTVGNPTATLRGQLAGNGPFRSLSLYYTAAPTTVIDGRTVPNYAGQLIAPDVRADDHGRWSYRWDTIALPAGAYYVYATLNNGAGPSVNGYSTGVVRVVQPARPAPRDATEVRQNGWMRLMWSPPARGHRRRLGCAAARGGAQRHPAGRPARRQAGAGAGAPRERGGRPRLRRGAGGDRALPDHPRWPAPVRVVADIVSPTSTLTVPVAAPRYTDVGKVY